MKAIKEIWDYREMLFSLVKKDMITRYKGSILGFLWTFINPLFQLLIYSVVFTVFMPIEIDNYAMHLFVALVPWLFCASSIQMGSTCVMSASGLVQKVYFPRIILPISTVCSNFMNMVFSFIVVFVALFITGVGVSPAALYLPLIMVIEFFFVLGLVLIFSALTVYFRDLEHILGIFVNAWFYLTPIIYTIKMVPPQFMGLMYANPMTSVILAYRDILYYKQAPQMTTLLSTVCFAVAFMVIGYFSFQKLQKKFAEEL